MHSDRSLERKNLMDNQTYLVYLSELKNRVFKILPLCEEKNNHIDKYLDSLIIELKGITLAYPDIINSKTAWYVKVLSSLFTFYEDYTIEELHSPNGISRIRSQIFMLINLIEKERRLVENELF